jgi:hypothetical protein
MCNAKGSQWACRLRAIIDISHCGKVGQVAGEIQLRGLFDPACRFHRAGHRSRLAWSEVRPRRSKSSTRHLTRAPRRTGPRGGLDYDLNRGSLVNDQARSPPSIISPAIGLGCQLLASNLMRLHRLRQCNQIVRQHTDNAAARAVDVGYQHERNRHDDGQDEKQK